MGSVINTIDAKIAAYQHVLDNVLAPKGYIISDSLREVTVMIINDLNEIKQEVIENEGSEV